MIPAGLYAFADATYGDPWRQLNILAEEGVGVVQLRCKGWSTADLAALATRAVALGGPRIIVNDDVAAARAAGAWVHVGQEDGATDLVHGRSTHTLAQVTAPHTAVYLGFGPVFATTTKVPRHPPRGLELLEEAVHATALPVVAIGGITVDNLDGVRRTGVHAWAVIGAVWTAPDPRALIAALR